MIIYTAIFGDRDKLHPPLFTADGIRIICFTDSKKNKAAGVDTIIEAPRYPNSLGRSARWHKTHPPTSGDSLYVDGSYQLIGDPRPALASLKTGIGLVRHPTRSCAYLEAIQCAARKKDRPTVILRQMMDYEKRGFPVGFGLWEGGMILRRTGCPTEWSNVWWNSIENWSTRDQLSLAFALWETGTAFDELPEHLPGVLKLHHHEGVVRHVKNKLKKPLA